ncbi:AarF/ABC1/UbiB kinase family protein [Arenicella sp. 4NH20-0111]|uniref:ABC1 kinase family protein n=1 Tax=Arenicella sp. 4NH20-0111 TaxID=3127648 RepID=UPI00310C05FA
MKKIKQGGFSRRLSLGVAGARGGLGLLQARASGLLLSKDKQQLHNDLALEKEARRFVQHLGELKGAYVKIGQMLALYGEHILPAPVTDALHTLESATNPLDWSVIEPAIMAELGVDNLSDFVIDPKAMAAASLSQVHKASRDGNASHCFKIQYPGIADAIEDDFKNVMQMLSLARWVKSGKQLEVLALELKTYLLREVDYRHELNTAEKVRGLLKADQRYVVPQFFPQHCSDKLLVMELVDGEDVLSDRVQSLSQQRRDSLAECMLELFFKEIFEWGLMQTDPNFGNYRIQVGAEVDKLVLLDFGAVHPLPTTFTDPLNRTILSAQVVDTQRVIEGLIELNCLRESDSDTVKESFADFCCYILEPFRESYRGGGDYALSDGRYDWRASKLLKRAGKIGSKGMVVKGFAVPPSEFMLMVRKLTGVFTFVSALGAKTKSAHILSKYRR